MSDTTASVHALSQEPLESNLPSFDLLLSSALRILSNAALSPDPRWHTAAMQHLHWLVEHPDCESAFANQRLNGCFKKNLEKLLAEWRQLHLHPLPVH